MAYKVEDRNGIKRNKWFKECTVVKFLMQHFIRGQF